MTVKECLLTKKCIFVKSKYQFVDNVNVQFHGKLESMLLFESAERRH